MAPIRALAFDLAQGGFPADLAVGRRVPEGLGALAITFDHFRIDRDVYAFATDFTVRAMQTEDSRAGIDAFVNKKPKPDWSGR